MFQCQLRLNSWHCPHVVTQIKCTLARLSFNIWNFLRNWHSTLTPYNQRNTNWYLSECKSGPRVNIRGQNYVTPGCLHYEMNYSVYNNSIHKPLRQKTGSGKQRGSPSLHSGPAYEVMLQSQLKPSHCCKQTPWLEQESSWQVVLGPGEREGVGAVGYRKLGKDENTLILDFDRSPVCSLQYVSMARS